MVAPTVALEPGCIRVEGLTWRPMGCRRPTLDDVAVAIEPGERVLVVGPSGAGKSTLLYALSGALGTTLAGELSGDARVGGRLGLVLQNPADAVVAEHTGRDVAFGLENEGHPREHIWPEVDAALAAVDLPYGRNHLVSALSGGELQRLVLAGVLAVQPDVLLLDEPTSMLDARSAAAARDAILSAAEGRTMVLVEHRFEPWVEHVDRVVVLGGGGVIESDGPVADFLAGPSPRGVWMPGAPAPVPTEILGALVTPDASPLPLIAEDVEVTLVTRTLRGVQRTAALRRFDGRFDSGRLSALVGPSGSGKSTALAALGGLQRVQAGRITPDRSRMSSRDLASQIGWVPQNPEHTFLAHTVRDEVELTARRLGLHVDVDAGLDAVGLAGHADVHPFRLSGGEKRRLAILAGLAHRPGVILLDEPTVGQDPDSWAAVVGWLVSAAAAGAAVVVATHDDQLPADAVMPLVMGVSA
ncbi:MAG TPA: ATP-binding cassette domain-containing protein [Aeromicrobium sp.]|nr:ATP-binding cassette domain-containing protein [Aeromicrobium sp.]